MSHFVHLSHAERSDPELLSQLVVGRESILKEISGALRKPDNLRERRHYFLLGQRGAGKTAVVNLIAHRVSCDKDLRQTWIPIFAPEENYGATNLSDLLLQMLDDLKSKINTQKNPFCFPQPTLARIARQVDDIPFAKPAERASASIAIFRDLFKEHETRIIFSAENIDRLVTRVLKNDEESLLNLLKEEWLVAVVTSTTFLRHRKFLRLFKNRRLKDLSPEEELDALRKLAEASNDSLMVDYVRTNEPRLRALYHFTGGNPRQMQLLYRILSDRAWDPEGPNLPVSELEMLLDQMTPYYQERMTHLSDQGAMLVEALSLGPSSPSGLANRLEMNTKVVSTVLSRLERLGYVERERLGRRAVYKVSGRLFGLWHTMNRTRNSSGKYYHLLEFYTAFYAHHERFLPRDFRLQTTTEGVTPAKHRATHTDYVKVLTRKWPFEAELGRLRSTRYESSLTYIEAQLDKIDSEYSDNVDYQISKGCLLARDLGLHDAGLECFRRALTLNPTSVWALYNKAVALDKTGEHFEARAGYQRAAVSVTPAGDPVVKAGSPNSRDVVEALFYTLEHVVSPQVCRVATFSLSRAAGFYLEEHSSALITRLLPILNSAAEPWRKQNCVTVLGFISSIEALPILIRLIDDDSTLVRIAATRALGQIGSHRAVDSLTRLYESEIVRHDTAKSEAWKHGRTTNLRTEAVRSLGKLCTQSAAPILMRALADTAPPVRANAIRALANTGETSAYTVIRRLLQDDPIAYVRGRAAEGLGRLAPGTAVTDLLGALADRDPYVRLKAAAALGFSADPEPVPHLATLLNGQPDRVRCKASLALVRLAIFTPPHTLREAARVAIELASASSNRRVAPIAQLVLCTACKTGDLDKAAQVVSEVEHCKPDLSRVVEPYEIALRYRKHGSDPRILGRAPEHVREAAVLLLNDFDWRGARSLAS